MTKPLLLTPALIAVGFCSSFFPAAIEGQAQMARFGVVVGRTTSDQLWTPSVGTASRDGYLAGGFAEVGLSGMSVSVRVEGDYVQRGAIVERDTEGAPVAGEIRTEYLSFALHVKLSKSIGPLSVHIALGPTMDQLLRNRSTPVLEQVLYEKKTTSLGIGLGGGFSLHLFDKLIPEFDIRLTEGLSPAYVGSFTTVRNRSLEFLLRFGVPRSLG